MEQLPFSDKDDSEKDGKEIVSGSDGPKRPDTTDYGEEARTSEAARDQGWGATPNEWRHEKWQDPHLTPETKEIGRIGVANAREAMNSDSDEEQN